MWCGRLQSSFWWLIVVTGIISLVALFILHVRGIQHNVATPSNYNLLEDGRPHPAKIECTEEYMNTQQLEQDHPCVIDIIRKIYLRSPPSPRRPYHVRRPNNIDPSAGQAAMVLSQLTYPSNGFFIECGAHDGEFLSNTLYMESTLDWTGLLIEPNPKSYASLLRKNRKAWTLPVCLSLDPYPSLVQFYALDALGSIGDEHTNRSVKDRKLVTSIQCFPLYSILLAVNRTQVDFFSLDVDGHELKVLKTIPWHKVDIKTLTTEWEHIKEVDEKGLIRYMTDIAGYLMFNRLDYGAKDLFFISAKHAHKATERKTVLRQYVNRLWDYVAVP